MTDANKSAAASSASSPVDIHGPDCDHDHDHVGHVHGPDCNDDHHGHHKAPIRQVMRAGPKIGRNDTCPCGSGKKYKKCCMPA